MRAAALVLAFALPATTVEAQRTPTVPPPADSALADGRFTIAFVGDVLLAGSAGAAIARNGVHWPWEGTREAFARADLVVANLETAVATGGTAENKQFTFRADPATLEGLAAAGVHLVTLANNHAFDYGAAALLETLQHLDRHGVRRVGAGASAAEAYAPVVYRIEGLRVGFIGVSRVYPFAHWQATESRPGVASGYDYALDAVLAAVDAARPEVDALFVLVHWGAELADQPREIDLAFAEALLSHGVTGVIGHHPHVLQGFSFSPERGIVAWSLGNFLFRSFRDETRMTAVLYVDVRRDGSLAGARVEPMYIDDIRPRPARERADAVLGRVRRLSAAFGTELGADGVLSDPLYRPPPAIDWTKVRIPVLRVP